jgi:hypothetical protein
MKHRFVEFVPEILEDKVLYISVKYGTINHLCVCGCGLEVVTPISPADWQFSYNGEAISLFPSIGNWDYPCKSHYWIKNNEIIWARSWSEKEIEEGRYYDMWLNDYYLKSYDLKMSRNSKRKFKKESIMGKIKNLLFFKF